MSEINYVAIIVAVILCFIASMVWYMVFGKELAKLNPKAYGNMKKPQPVKMLSELARNFILAVVMAQIVLHFGILHLSEAIGLGLLLWIGFPFVMLTGSVIYEKVPKKIAVIHAGDLLIKLVIIAVTISLWR